MPEKISRWGFPRKFPHAVLVTLVVAGLAVTGLRGAGAATVPATVLLDGAQLVSIRTKLAHPDSGLRAALAQLTKQATADLTAGPWSVMDKTQTPPGSGDRHEYYSQAPYWWPGSGPGGCPYVHRDGERNPAVDKISDHAERDASWAAIHDLALAWFFTGNAKYAARAELDARTWFLNAATRMRPDMTYAQVIPCTTTLTGTGIIEASESLPQVLDGLAVLDAGAPGWTSADRSGIRSWLRQFLTWSRTSDQGVQESAATNNHGSFKDLLDASVALYTGQSTVAHDLANGARTNRIAVQIMSDGSQPLELSRTRSWHYSNFNVTALCRLAEVGQKLGVKLWSYKAPSGGTLAKAVDFLIPAAEKGTSAWPYQDIDGLDRTLPRLALHAAAQRAGDAKAKAALANVPTPAGGDTWPLLPTC